MVKVGVAWRCVYMYVDLPIVHHLYSAVYMHTTLKKWEWPGDEAIYRTTDIESNSSIICDGTICFYPLF